MNFSNYIKAAFLNHYNLAVYIGALMFSIMSGAILGGFALFTAVELIYLVSMASNPRFQRVINSIHSQKKAIFEKIESDKKLQPILDGLEWPDRNRFTDICEKCKALQKNAFMGESEGMSDITNAQASDVNRLLWIFLKILVAKKTVSNFIATVSEPNLQKEVEKQEKRLKVLGGTDSISTDIIKEQKRAAIQDILDSAKKRLSNLQTTRANIEIFDLRLEQIESKLNALSEVALNRHDSIGIAASIDNIARDVEISESTINDLKDATGIALSFEDIPSIVNMSTVETPKPFQFRKIRM